MTKQMIAGDGGGSVRAGAVEISQQSGGDLKNRRGERGPETLSNEICSGECGGKPEVCREHASRPAK